MECALSKNSLDKFKFLGFDNSIKWETSTLPDSTLSQRIHTLNYEKAGIDLPPKETKRIFVEFVVLPIILL